MRTTFASPFVSLSVLIATPVLILGCVHFGIEAPPSSSPRTPAAASDSINGAVNLVKMDLEHLKAAAFARCQSPFYRPVVVPVPDLDPPANGGAANTGMVFQEELAVKTANFLDRDGFYFSPRPRAALNKVPMEIFVDADGSGLYQHKSWDDASPDYSSETIQPPIDKDSLPSAARVLTEMIIGHKSPTGDYPQLFDIRSSAYLRFAGYPPQVTGASMRLGAHRIFSKVGAHAKDMPEDFPLIRDIYLGVATPQTATALLLIENELFCGAISLDMTEGENAVIVADQYFYTRKSFSWKDDPNTAFIAYSSMFLRPYKHHTHSRLGDAAHDSDTLIVSYSGGSPKQFAIQLPAKGVQIQDISSHSSKPVSSWSLANLDRDPAHYSAFEAVLGSTNYDKRASYNVAILESNVKTGLSLYIQATGVEYEDNVVAASTLRQDLKKSASVEDFAHFKYKTTAFYPVSSAH